MPIDGINSYQNIAITKKRQNQSAKEVTGQKSVNSTSSVDDSKVKGTGQQTKGHVTYNGQTYNNAYAMLNSNPQIIKNNTKMFSTNSKTKDAFAGYDYSKSASKNSKTTGKTNSSDNTANNIKSADSKESLTKALENGATELKGLKGIFNEVKSALQDLLGKETKAEGQDKVADATLNKEQTGLQKNENTHTQTQSKLETSKTNYTQAQQNTKSAESALASAKAGATKDNPNTAAISKAEAQLKQAKTAEENAKKELDKATKDESDAQKQVDTSKESVNKAQNNKTETTKAVEDAKQEVSKAQNETNQVKDSQKVLDTSVKDGQKKLADMNENIPKTNTSPPDNNQQIQNQQAPPNSQQSDQIVDNKSDDNKTALSPRQQKIAQAKNDVENLQPGQSVKIGADTYSKDNDGNISINGQKMDDSSLAGRSAENSMSFSMRQQSNIDAENVALKKTKHSQ